MGKQRCPSCNGTGDMVFYTRGGFGTVRDCDMCHGTGEIQIVGSKKCPTCGGSGRVKVGKMKNMARQKWCLMEKQRRSARTAAGEGR